jgi:hypothetical protein
MLASRRLEYVVLKLARFGVEDSFVPPKSVDWFLSKDWFLMMELSVLELTRDLFLVGFVSGSCVGCPMDCMPGGNDSRRLTTVFERQDGDSGRRLKIVPLRIRGTWVSVGIFAHSTREIIVFATRARESGVAWIRSSRKKISSSGKPLPKQDSRNFVMFDVWNMPSSRGSIRAIDPGRILFISLPRAKKEIRRIEFKCQ